MTRPGQSAASLAFLCSAAVCVWMLLMNIRPIQDPDVWWHLASGRFMVTHAAIPKTDVFSLTARGSPWVNTYWLQDVLVYGLVCLGGLRALTMANALAIAALVFWIGGSQEARRLSWAARLFGIVWIFLAGQPRGYGWEEKASLVTLAFLALLFHMVRSRAWTSQKRWMLAWPWYFLLWANLHRGFILGLACLAAYVLEEWFSDPGARSRLASFYIACLVATLVNPWGLQIYGMGWQDFHLSPTNVTGWAQTPFAHLELYWVTLILFWGLVAVLVRERRALGIGFWVMSLLLSGLSLRYASFYRYFVIWAVPWALAVLDTRTPWLKGNRLLPWAGALALLFSFPWNPHFGVNRRIFPVEAIEFLKQNDLRAPFFHDYLLGGYYLWALEGKPPVLMDGRYPAVEGYRTFWPDMQAAIQGEPVRFQEFLARRGLRAAVVKYPSTAYLAAPFTVYFPRREWALVYWDDVVLIFVRRDAERQAVIARHEFKALEPDANPSYWKSRVWDQATPGQKNRIRAELERNAALHPASRMARLWLGIISS